MITYLSHTSVFFTLLRNVIHRIGLQMYQYFKGVLPSAISDLFITNLSTITILENVINYDHQLVKRKICIRILALLVFTFGIMY